MTTNIKNKLITEKDVKEIFKKADPTLFDTKVNDISWYQRAFVHKSYCTNMDEAVQKDTFENNVFEELEGYSESFQMKTPLPEFQSNERLEFLGDSILDAIVKEYLYDRFEISDEGFLTKLKIKLVRSERLILFGDYLEFSQFLLLSNKMENLTYKGVNRGRNNKRFMEDCFEAFIGSIMKDNESCGYYIAKKFIIGLIENLVDFSELIVTNDNFKDSLLRLFQSKKIGDPKYTDLCHEGSQTNRIFTKAVFVKKDLLDSNYSELLKEYNKKRSIVIRDEGNEVISQMEKNGFVLVSIGKGKSKKEAEQLCGKWALTNLKVSWNY